MKQLDYKNISKLCEISKATFYKWRKENRPVLELVEKYFTNDEIKEFLEKKEISKWEFLKRSYDEEIKENVIDFKNILDEISDELINFNDSNNLENMSILFMKIILFLTNETNISKFYNISELILVYAKRKDEALSESIIELNRIIAANVKNKSFIPFLYELGRNDLMDLLNDRPFELKKYETEHYFIHYTMPYWNLKYNTNDHKPLQQTGFNKSIDIFEILFPNYVYENKYTKRDIIKMFKEYYNQIKKD